MLGLMMLRPHPPPTIPDSFPPIRIGCYFWIFFHSGEVAVFLFFLATQTNTASMVTTSSNNIPPPADPPIM